MLEMDIVNVAITGELWLDRAEVAKLINGTSNGRFSKEMNLSTHYLVCAARGTKKEIKAARWGTAVISEAELRSYIDAGSFPSTKLPANPVHVGRSFPEIVWDEPFSIPCWYTLSYEDAKGNFSVRKIIVTGLGHSANNPETEWLGGYDGPQFKTWRKDRIVNIEFFAPVENSS